MSWEDRKTCSQVGEENKEFLQPAHGSPSSSVYGRRIRRSSRGRAPLACNESDGLDEMEQLFLRADSALDGEYGNGLLGMTPQPSPLPNCSRNSTPGLRYRNLGKSGLKVSNIGLATWMLSNESPETLETIVTLAYENGINLFDLSDAYSGPAAETELGKILKRKNWKRTSYIVIVKIYWTSKIEERALSRKYIVDCVKASLERLQLEFIDVVIIHRVDSNCPMEEIVRSMNLVINNGWAMYWGTSKWTPVEIMEAYSNCRQFNCITPIVEQAEYHFFCREKPELYMTELYNKIGVGLMTWSPITMSFYKAFGKNSEESMALAFRSSMKGWAKERSISAEDSSTQKQRDQARISREIAALAEKHGCSLAQLVIAWVLKNDPVQCMLIGPTSTPDLVSYIQALQLVPKLTTTVMNELEKILENRPQRPPMISTLALNPNAVLR